MHLNNRRQLPGEMSFQRHHDNLLCRPPTTATYGRPWGSNVSSLTHLLSPLHPNPPQLPSGWLFAARSATSDQKLREIGSDFVGGVENVTCRRRELITVRSHGRDGVRSGGELPARGLIVAVAHEDEGKRYLLSNGVYSTP